MDFPIFSHCKGSIASRDFPRLDELMRRGVPAQQRAEIWFEISGAQELQQRYQEMYVTRMAEMYGNLRWRTLGFTVINMGIHAKFMGEYSGIVVDLTWILWDDPWIWMSCDQKHRRSLKNGDEGNPCRKFQLDKSMQPPIFLAFYFKFFYFFYGHERTWQWKMFLNSTSKIDNNVVCFFFCPLKQLPSQAETKDPEELFRRRGTLCGCFWC